MLARTQRKVIVPERVLALLRKEHSFLDREGIKILPASSNSEALELHRAEGADLIVAELDSPEMSGEDLCSAVREDSGLRQVSIMVLCADSDNDYDRCLSCRANAFMKVPLNMAVFLQEAHHLLSVARREACRVDVDLEVSLESGQEKLTGHSENISTSGILVVTEAELNEGDTIACTFTLPGEGTFGLEATVVRVMEGPEGKKKYGLSFMELGESAMTSLALFAKKQG
jgi:DNA-binding response OmpR family regulator